VLFALLTGRPPWPETDIRRLLIRLKRREGPALDAFDDSPLADVCRRALAIDPAKRYADAEAFSEAIDELANREKRLDRHTDIASNSAQ
jgi:serine/threonine protein kinase